MRNKHNKGAICLIESVVVMVVVAAAGEAEVEEAVAEVVTEVDSTDDKRIIDVVGGRSSCDIAAKCYEGKRNILDTALP